MWNLWIKRSETNKHFCAWWVLESGCCRATKSHYASVSRMRAHILPKHITLLDIVWQVSRETMNTVEPETVSLLFHSFSLLNLFFIEFLCRYLSFEHTPPLSHAALMASDCNKRNFIGIAMLNDERTTCETALFSASNCLGKGYAKITFIQSLFGDSMCLCLCLCHGGVWPYHYHRRPRNWRT